MDIIQSLLGQSSWPSLIFTALGLFFGGYYIKQTSKNKAEEIAREAHKEAIEARTCGSSDQIKLQALPEAGIRVTMDGWGSCNHKNEQKREMENPDG
jgi:hypothetical protein